MSSLDRTIDGDALVRHLTLDEATIDQGLVARHGRSARTLVKEGPLRLTLIALAPGGVLPEHAADGPISVHVVDGQFLFSAAGGEYPLHERDVLIVAAGVRHSARSETGGTFLLTVYHLPSPGTPLPAGARPQLP